MNKVDRFGMILLGFLIGIIFFSNPVVTEEVIVEKEVPIEAVVEKEVIKEVPAVQKQIGKKYKEGGKQNHLKIRLKQFELLNKNINQNRQEEQHETINIIKPDKRRKLFWFLLCD